LTVDHSDGHNREQSPESTDGRTARSPASSSGLRRHREETGPAPILLRHRGLNGEDVSLNNRDALSDVVLELPLSNLAQLLTQRAAVQLYHLVQKLFATPGNTPPCLRHHDLGSHAFATDICADLSLIILELPLSELAQLLPPRFAAGLYERVRKWLAEPQGSSFPCSLASLRHNPSRLAALRSRLACANDLSELIVDPPAILIDERQWLFFYRGVPIPLRPVLFSYLFLLAQSPREVVPREAIYSHLWPGELDFEGSNKPYEVQVSDHKRKLMARIRKGIAGRVEIREGEVDELITTKAKIGYVLNCNRENILILRKGDYTGPSFPVCLLALGQCLADWLDWLWEAPGILWLC